MPKPKKSLDTTLNKRGRKTYTVKTEDPGESVAKLEKRIENLKKTYENQLKLTKPKKLKKGKSASENELINKFEIEEKSITLDPDKVRPYEEIEKLIQEYVQEHNIDKTNGYKDRVLKELLQDGEITQQEAELYTTTKIGKKRVRDLLKQMIAQEPPTQKRVTLQTSKSKEKNVTVLQNIPSYEKKEKETPKAPPPTEEALRSQEEANLRRRTSENVRKGQILREKNRRKKKKSI